MGEVRLRAVEDLAEVQTSRVGRDVGGGVGVAALGLAAGLVTGSDGGAVELKGLGLRDQAEQGLRVFDGAGGESQDASVLVGLAARLPLLEGGPGAVIVWAFVRGQRKRPSLYVRLRSRSVVLLGR